MKTFMAAILLAATSLTTLAHSAELPKCGSPEVLEQLTTKLNTTMTQQYIFNPDVKTTAGTSRELYILGNVKYCAVDGTFMGGMPIINNGIEYTVGYTEDGNLYVTPIRVGTIYF